MRKSNAPQKCFQVTKKQPEPAECALSYSIVQIFPSLWTWFLPECYHQFTRVRLQYHFKHTPPPHEKDLWGDWEKKEEYNRLQIPTVTIRPIQRKDLLLHSPCNALNIILPHPSCWQMEFMFNSRFVSTDVQEQTAIMKYSKKKQKCRTDSILDYLNMFIPIKRTCCVTLKNLCSNFPLRLYCIKVHFSGCDDAACIGFTNALDLPLFPLLLSEPHTAREHYHTDTWMALKRCQKG